MNSVIMMVLWTVSLTISRFSVSISSCRQIQLTTHINRYRQTDRQTHSDNAYNKHPTWSESSLETGLNSGSRTAQWSKFRIPLPSSLQLNRLLAVSFVSVNIHCLFIYEAAGMTGLSSGFPTRRTGKNARFHGRVFKMCQISRKIHGRSLRNSANLLTSTAQHYRSAAQRMCERTLTLCVLMFCDAVNCFDHFSSFSF